MHQELYFVTVLAPRPRQLETASRLSSDVTGFVGLTTNKRLIISANLISADGYHQYYIQRQHPSPDQLMPLLLENRRSIKVATIRESELKGGFAIKNSMRSPTAMSSLNYCYGALPIYG